MHLQSIEDDPSQSRELGVNQESALMEIETFDLCSGALLSDVMHDLLEGVLQYETKLLLKHCLHNCYFTLDILNRSIEYLELPYGTESDRPSPITSKIPTKPGGRLNQKGKYECMHMPNVYRK